MDRSEQCNRTNEDNRPHQDEFVGYSDELGQGHYEFDYRFGDLVRSMAEKHLPANKLLQRRIQKVDSPRGLAFERAVCPPKYSEGFYVTARKSSISEKFLLQFEGRATVSSTVDLQRQSMCARVECVGRSAGSQNVTFADGQRVASLYVDLLDFVHFG